MGTASPAFKKTKEGCFTSACDPKSQNAEQHWGGGGGHCHRHMYPLWLNCLGTYTILLTSLPLIDIWGVSALGHWNTAAVNTRVQVSGWRGFTSPGYIPRSRVARSQGDCLIP